MPFDDFTGIATGEPPDGPVPAYPLASNLRPGRPARAGGACPDGGAAPRRRVPDAVREQLRALIVEELEQLIKR